MSGFKYSMVICLLLFSFLVGYLSRGTEYHQVSLYTEQGDTIIVGESDIKIWIEDGKPDIWINQEEGGWIRK